MNINTIYYNYLCSTITILLQYYYNIKNQNIQNKETRDQLIKMIKQIKEADRKFQISSTSIYNETIKLQR